MIIADNGCDPSFSTISVQLTECPTCLGDDKRHSAAGDWDSEISNEAPGNSRAYSNKETATVDTDDDEWNVAKKSSECQVPRQVEKPVASLNQDNSAVIAWSSQQPSVDAKNAVTYQVAWDSGSFWEDAPRQDLTTVMTSPFVWADLNPLVTYRFAVRAINDCGAGPFSVSTDLVAT